MDDPAKDRYELQEFIDAGATAGFVTTRICGNDQYETLIERRIDMLEKRGRVYRLYRLQGDLKEVLR